MCKLYITLVRSAPRASKVAPKQPHPPTTIASPSTTLAPTPRRQRLTTVGGWCDTIIQPFLSRFSARRFYFQAFLWHKNAWMANLVFWTQNQQRTHHKVSTARPPKAIHTTIYAKGACPYTHRATHNHHTKCAGLPWWLFGSRRARIVCKGSPHTFCTNPAVFRARPCQVDNDAGRAPRLNYCGSLGALLLSSHNSLAGRRVERRCQLGMNVLELQ